LNERIRDVKIELEHLDKCVETYRDSINNQLYDHYNDSDFGDFGWPKRKTVRGRLDDLTKDIDLLKEYLKVEKAHTPASTKFVKRKGK
jgi:hypothetical protein